MSTSPGRVDPVDRRSSSNTTLYTLHFTRLEGMAALQRLIIFLIVIYAVLSVGAASLESEASECFNHTFSPLWSRSLACKGVNPPVMKDSRLG